MISIKTMIRGVNPEFHNPGFVKNIGRNFDAKAFVSAYRESGVNTINTLFTKCHHGYSYYDTQIGTKHPHLKIDMVGEITEEARRQGIKVKAYYSIGWDDLAAHNNKDWVQVTKDGEKLLAKGDDPEKRWSSMCVNTPYCEELVYPQLREILEKYPVDGIYFDIVNHLYHQDACYCRYCLQKMRKTGVNPDRLDQVRDFQVESVRSFLEKAHKLIKSHNPEAVVTSKMYEIGQASKFGNYEDYLHIESLPEGGWGYIHSPIHTRYTRNTGKPIEVITGLTHMGWASFGSIKHENQLKYELATALANGASVSVGDPLIPELTIIRPKYELLKKGYDFVREREKWCEQAKSVPDVAVVGKDNLYVCRREGLGVRDMSLAGAAKFLMESHIQFDILDTTMVAEGKPSLHQFSLLILPNVYPLSGKTIENIKNYVREGGKVISTYRTSLEKNKFLLGELYGVKFSSFSPYSMGYVSLESENIKKGVPEMKLDTYQSFIQCFATSTRAEILAQFTNPLTERSRERYYSHFYAPPGGETIYPAIVKNKHGKGEVIYVATSLFQNYYTTDYWAYRRLLSNCVNLISPERVLSVDAPSWVETSLMQQPGKDRYVVHFVNYHPTRRGNTNLERIEEVCTCTNIRLEVEVPEQIKKVYAAPSETDLEWKVVNGKLAVTLPSLKLHEMVVIEYKKGV